MEIQDKEKVQSVVQNAIEDAFGELNGILDKYDIVIRMAEISEVSGFVLKMLQAKIN